MTNLFHIILALLGISFLVFIHELGHYIMARRVGMKVEIFSIGFGKPIYQWEMQGVKWQVCWLLFGGFVRIAGMEKQGSLEPHQIPDGFFGKKPWARIKVALMGPLANIVFAFIAFSAIWAMGGQQKPFQKYTNIIGEIDPQSKLYPLGVRPGDTLSSVSGTKEQGFQDFFVQIVLSQKTPTVEGSLVDYWNGSKKPFSYTPDSNLRGMEAAQTLGIGPAQYLVFDRFSSVDSPMKDSGIQKGDRIVWVDGQLAFSREQLSQLINAPQTLLTIRRGNQNFLTHVPRLKISDFRLSVSQKAEFDDWLHEAGLVGKAGSFFFIPYNLNHDAIVESCLTYLDNNAEETCHVSSPRDPFDAPLQAGDQIIAVEGTPISSSSELLSKMQAKQSLIVVQRQKQAPVPSWTEADKIFESSFDAAKLKTLISRIGSPDLQTQIGDLILLPPISLKPLSELPLDEATKKQSLMQYEAQRRAIEKIEDPELREKELLQLEAQQKRWMLGILLSDRVVAYNPSPFVMFTDVASQTWRSFLSLISGAISPKYLSGPVSIVGVLQSSWNTGFKEALFWLGFISLNLAFLNLLPIPVLDGGHILFSIIESITKKPLKAKTMERLILPFIIIIVAFFIYVTYQDLVRLLGQFL